MEKSRSGLFVCSFTYNNKTGETRRCHALLRGKEYFRPPGLLKTFKAPLDKLKNAHGSVSKSLFSVSEKSTLILSCLTSHPPRVLSIIIYLCIEYLNSFDVPLVTCLCVCVCSQAFRQTLSRATEIASRNSLRSTTHMSVTQRTEPFVPCWIHL